MILCFEGPSAIGKTSLSSLFAGEYAVVPEVNVLFEGQQRTGRYWYHERQTDRFRIASLAGNAILDGDPFQALWYAWSFGFPQEYLDLKSLLDFYQNALSTGKLRFPDAYFIFRTHESVLRHRKLHDRRRQRHNFEKHLKLTRTLPAYFGHLQQLAPGRVVMIEFSDLDSAYEGVLEGIASLDLKGGLDDVALLEALGKWLFSQDAQDFHQAT